MSNFQTAIDELRQQIRSLNIEKELEKYALGWWLENIPPTHIRFSLLHNSIELMAPAVEAAAARHPVLATASADVSSVLLSEGERVVDFLVLDDFEMLSRVLAYSAETEAWSSVIN